MSLTFLQNSTIFYIKWPCHVLRLIIGSFRIHHDRASFYLWSVDREAGSQYVADLARFPNFALATLQQSAEICS